MFTLEESREGAASLTDGAVSGGRIAVTVQPPPGCAARVEFDPSLGQTVHITVSWIVAGEGAPRQASQAGVRQQSHDLETPAFLRRPGRGRIKDGVDEG